MKKKRLPKARRKRWMPPLKQLIKDTPKAVRRTRVAGWDEMPVMKSSPSKISIGGRIYGVRHVSLEEWNRADAVRKKRLGLHGWEEIGRLRFPGVFTVHFDYFATGEGRTVGLLVCKADDPGHLRKTTERAFSPFFASGCEIARGISIPPVARRLISEQTLRMAKRMAKTATNPRERNRAGAFSYHAEMHVNYS